MPRKRKLDSSKAAGNAQPSKKQQQLVEAPPPQPQEEEEEEQEVQAEGEQPPGEPEGVQQQRGDAEEECEEVEGGEDEQEEEEDDDDEDPEEGNDDSEGNGDKLKSDQGQNAYAATNQAAKDSVVAESGSQPDVEDDEEPIRKLLEPFSKDQLVSMLCEAAESHRDVAERIRGAADRDPVHRKIFVHGLGWDTTAETLINEFKRYGEIEDCKAVTDKISGKSKGYAFILFKSRKGARNALQQPQKKIGNRMTACQLASVGPVPSQSAAQSAAQAPPESEYTRRKIYVSNVGAELDPHKLYTFFAKYGEIEEGPLGLDKATGKPKGFCLFVYKTVESARRALEEPHKNFEGHILHCQKAIDGPKPGKGKQQQNLQSGHFQRNDNLGFAGAAATPGHLMAPSGPNFGYSQGAAAAQPLNPALGQALTALLSNPAAGLGLTNLLGSLGSAVGANPAVPGPGPGVQGAYGGQANISPGIIGYGNQGMQGGYGSQPLGPGAGGRGQHGVGQYGGVGH